MRRNFRTFLPGLLFCMILVCSVRGEGNRSITLGTFNVQHFGEKEDASRIDRIADICRGIDLLALQEIHPDGVDAIGKLAKAMGDEYLWAVSDETTWERFAFIWRSPVTSLEEPVLMTGLKLGRKPFRGRFQAGNFDFELINLHLFWDGSKKTYPHTRAVEFKLLDDWMSYREDEELDVIITGDFNAPNMFYGLRFPPPLSSHYFFYEWISRHNLISVSIEKGIPTSIANENIYDHFIFNPAHNFVEEFAGFENVRILQWDHEWDKNQDGKLSWNEHNEARLSVTDHRAVTCMFYIDLPDDDEEENQDQAN